MLNYCLGSHFTACAHTFMAREQLTPPGYFAEDPLILTWSEVGGFLEEYQDMKCTYMPVIIITHLAMSRVSFRQTRLRWTLPMN